MTDDKQTPNTRSCWHCAGSGKYPRRPRLLPPSCRPGGGRRPSYGLAQIEASNDETEICPECKGSGSYQAQLYLASAEEHEFNSNLGEAQFYRPSGREGGPDRTERAALSALPEGSVNDERRELVDLISTCDTDELAVVARVIRVLLDELDAFTRKDCKI